MRCREGRASTLALARPKGASIAQVEQAAKWQAHSLRAALTALRKEGYQVARSRDDSTTRYRFVRQRAVA